MKNYCLSTWIGNLGVVPLFLFSAFLFLPAFALLIFLLILVMVVLDDITISLRFNRFLNQKLRSILVFLFCLFVKIFLLFPITTTLATDFQEVSLAKGEQFELKIPALKRFSVGNDEVIKVKHIDAEGKLLIKGKVLGLSDLILWFQDNTQKTYKFYVTSKQEQVKMIELASSLSSENFVIKNIGDSVRIEGHALNLYDYKTLKKIQNDKKYQLMVSLTPKLRNHIIADIYKNSYGHQTNYINCHIIGINIICEYKGKKDNPFIHELAKKYDVQFEHVGNYHEKNLRIEYKVIQVETYSKNSIAPGLDKISGTLLDVLNTNQTLIDNQVLFNNQKLQATLIAQPQGLIRTGHTHKIQMGAEIPFVSSTQNQTNTNWKFAGLKVISKLKEESGKLIIDYQTEFTRPSDQQVTGSKGEGALYLGSNRFYKIFEMAYETQEEVSSKLPILGQIPILKYLFSSGNDTHSYKQILAFIKVTPQKD